MAITTTAVTPNGVKAHSVGPLKVEYATFSAASAATGGTCTATTLHTVLHAEVTGVTQTALPTYSGNVVTIAFADPAATVYGQIRMYGI